MSSEPAGQLNILSQDCFASPGVLVAGIGGAGLSVYPPDIVVSTLTTQPSGFSTFTTPNLLITQTADTKAANNIIGVTLQQDANSGGLESLEIYLASGTNISEDTGIMALNVDEYSGQPFINLEYQSTILAANANIYTEAQVFPLYILGCSTVVGVSSINGVSWSKISTVAANY